jgi:hypothetical protein
MAGQRGSGRGRDEQERDRGEETRRAGAGAVPLTDSENKVTVQEPGPHREVDSTGQRVGMPDADAAREAKLSGVLTDEDEGRTSVEEGQRMAQAANEQVAERLQPEQSAGYIGLNPDPTPNEHYTASGVNQGLPTPETDPEMRAKARANLRGDEFRA